jgi:NADPH:quinone reductase-like Zn-dependent oxidoreductase
VPGRVISSAVARSITSIAARVVGCSRRASLGGELFALIAAGVLTPGPPPAYELADGPKAPAELETRATVGKLALRP